MSLTVPKISFPSPASLVEFAQTIDRIQSTRAAVMQDLTQSALSIDTTIRNTWSESSDSNHLATTSYQTGASAVELLVK
jgi:hypothetical protein